MWEPLENFTWNLILSSFRADKLASYSLAITVPLSYSLFLHRTSEAQSVSSTLM